MNQHRVTLNQLIRIAENTTWEEFEAMPDGRLVLHDHYQTLLKDEEPISPLLWVFEMRIGTHFERPMQAIMCAGHFIRMRSAEPWGVVTLHKLDPARPGDCLYSNPSYGLSSNDTGVSWRPHIEHLSGGGVVGQLQVLQNQWPYTPYAPYNTSCTPVGVHTTITTNNTAGGVAGVNQIYQQPRGLLTGVPGWKI